MKKLTYTIALLAVFFALGQGALWAHGVAWLESPDDKAIVLHFYYTDGSDMAYSEVSIFSPENAEVPYQKGRTDKFGYFSFRPSSQGNWTFKVDDGQAHMAQGELEYTPQPLQSETMGTDAQEAPKAQAPRGGGAKATVADVILGLSLILNLALIVTLFFKKKKASGEKAA